LKTIELQVVTDHKAFDPLAEDLKAKLTSYYGTPFWSMDLQGVKEDILRSGWVRTVFLRRSFPDRLSVRVLAKSPKFLVRGKGAWIATDSDGVPFWVSEHIPGAWLDLPVIYGLENIPSQTRELSVLQREFSDFRTVFVDAAELLNSLKSQVGVEASSLILKEEKWKKALITVHFGAQRPDGKSSSVEITFLSEDWKSRLSSLQFVLSDLLSSEREEIRILGQYKGRWIVEGDALEKTFSKKRRR
jgi:hypothetical protein